MHDWVHSRTISERLELAEARFVNHRFSPHRHDTYAIGITTAGVQRFAYRGERHHALRGNVFVLHPDELHDGTPGTADGYRYRVAYLSPEVIAEAGGLTFLPFVAQPVQQDVRLRNAVETMLCEPGHGVQDLTRADVLARLADALVRLSDTPEPRSARLDIPAMKRIREHLCDRASTPVCAATLEREHGIDRYTLARHFRRLFGVSPQRFVIMRRLELVRRSIRAGTPLAEAAGAAGFADQSHMTREFRKAFGLSPSTWRRFAVQQPHE